jgi:putative membrane protein
MSKPKRLHPTAIFINSGKKIKRVIIPLIGLAFLGHKDEGRVLFTLMASIAVIIFTLFSSAISWFRYTYHLEKEELRIEYGIFIRKKRYISFERIQSLDMTEGVLHRLFGLAKVQVETAGGDLSDGAEAVLAAISKKEAMYIQDYFNSHKASVKMMEGLENHQEEELIFQITTIQLLLLSLTSGGAGVIISAVLALLSQMDDFIPYKKWFGGLEKLVSGSMMFFSILVFIGFVLIWIIALLGTMLKYANFTVIKKDGDLIISQGLLERRQITIPVKRIQSIRMSENWFRQMLGYATVYVESAGGVALDTKESNVILFPMIKRKQIVSTIDRYLTDYKIVTSFKRLPKRALSRYIMRSWYFVVPIVVVSILLLKAWGSISLILLLIVTYWAFLKYKDAGWNLENQQLSLQYRTLNRHTVFMKKNRIQTIEVYESYFQRKKQLATVEAFVKSGMGMGGGRVTDLENDDMRKIILWYSNHHNKQD